MRFPAPLASLMHGIRTDLISYGELKGLLEAQFDAAVHYQGEQLSQIASTILALAEDLEQRRRQRMDLARGVLGPGRRISMEAVFEQFPDTQRQVLLAGWQALESLVKECKALNQRNGRLLMDQHEIMKQVLEGEMDTYDPI